MSTIIFDIDQLYQRIFGTNPYKIPTTAQSSGASGKVFDSTGATLSEKYKETEMWLPSRIYAEVEVNDVEDEGKKPNSFYLPYSVIKISGKKTIVKTPMGERQGTVKELYSTDDYSISLKGFFIDQQNRTWPEQKIQAFKRLFELQTAVRLDNALSNIFLTDQKVVIESFELPEVEGGRKHVRPFNIQLESDSIFTLEVS